MPDRVDELFAEYADAYVRGERPSSADYLVRAGEEADALAGLIDRFVASAPASRPDAAALILMEAWLSGESPLLALRSRRGLKRDQVVDGLIERFGLDRGKREKVRRYYHELESGFLRPSRRLVEGLEEILGTPVSDLIALKSQALHAAPAYYRAGAMISADSVAAPASAPEPEDEIDRLFRPEA